MSEFPPVLVGERVLWLGSGSGIPKGGIVKWIGRLPEMGPNWAVGLQLDEALPYGGIDGTWRSRSLFNCKPKHGLIVPSTNVIREPQHTVVAENSKGTKEITSKKCSALSDGISSNRRVRVRDLSGDANLVKAVHGGSEGRRSKLSSRLRGSREGHSSQQRVSYSWMIERQRQNDRLVFKRMNFRKNAFNGSFDESLSFEGGESVSSSRSSGSRRDRSSRLFSLLKWFRKDKVSYDIETPSIPGSPVFHRPRSITGSVDTLFSTATANSFAFVHPLHYRPFGLAAEPEIRIAEAPETHTYRNRIRERDRLRHSERNISLQEKYRLYASGTLPRSVDHIHEISDLRITEVSPDSKNSTFGRKKKKAPPPPARNSSTSENSLPAVLGDQPLEEVCKQHRRALSEPVKYVKGSHVKGKRKAPQPPALLSDSDVASVTTSAASSIKRSRKKRRAPSPPFRNKTENKENRIFNLIQEATSDILNEAWGGEGGDRQDTDLGDSSDTQIIATDTLKLEKGILKPNKMDKSVSENTVYPTSPVSPRPWYKRTSANRESLKERERRKDKERRKVEDWMLESGFPRRSILNMDNCNNLVKLDKSEDKRRSQISILTNISELDREAAELIKQSKVREQNLIQSHNAKYYTNNEIENKTDIDNTREQESPRRSSAKDLISLFNAITNVTKVTVNSSLFSRDSNIFRRGSDNKKVIPVRRIAPTDANNGAPQTIQSNLVELERKDEVIQRRYSNPMIGELEEVKPSTSSASVGSESSNGEERPIAKVTIEELDEYDAERFSKAQALYEANRQNRQLSPPVIPTIAEGSENSPTSTITSNIRDIPSDSNISPARPLTVWVCPRCTLENLRWRITCEACDIWRPTPCELKEKSSKSTINSDNKINTKDVEEKEVPNDQSNNRIYPKISDLPNLSEININALLPTSENDEKLKNEEPQSDEIRKARLEYFDKNRPTGSHVNFLEESTKFHHIHEDNVDSTKFKNIKEDNVGLNILQNTKKGNVDPNKLQNLKEDNDGSNILQNIREDNVSSNFLQNIKNDNVDPTKLQNLKEDTAGSNILQSIKKDNAGSNVLQNIKKDNVDPTKLQNLEEDTAGSNILQSIKKDNGGSNILQNIKKNNDGSNILQNIKKDNADSSKLQNIKEDKVDQTLFENIKKDNAGKKQKVSETQDAEPKQNSKMNSVASGDDKQKLKEMLIEMKHSLPKRPKAIKNSENKHSNEEKIKADLSNVLVSGESSKSESINDNIIGTRCDKSPERAEAYLVESMTTVEEIKMKKPIEKVSSSAQTSGLIRQLHPQVKAAVGKEIIVPITVEDHLIKDGILYTSVSSDRKRIGTGTFELMRPRDFASIEAIKKGNDNIPLHLYANIADETNKNASHAKEGNISDNVVDNKSTDVDILSKQLTIPQGLANFKAGLEGKSEKNMNTLAVNKLLKRLEGAIAEGQHELAAALARELAEQKVSCSMKRQKPGGPSSEILVEMYVEDQHSHRGPFSIKVKPSMTVEELKRKIEREYEIPLRVQRWILGKQLAANDSTIIGNLGVIKDGTPIFLYLVAPDIDQVKDLEGQLEGVPSTSGISSVDAVSCKSGVDPPKQQKTSVDPGPSTSRVNTEEIIQIQENFNPNGTLALGWRCEVCTLLNSPTRPGCAACTTPRPDKYQVPKDYQVSENEIQRIENEVKNEKEITQAIEEENVQSYQELVDLEKDDLILSMERFECPVCFIVYPPMEGVVLRECLHVFCRDCLARTIQYSEEAEVKCPFRDDNYTCNSTLLEREIKMLVSRDIFEEHLAKSIALAETKIVNAFHCKTPDCKGWCIYEDNVNIFRCPVCTHSNCLTCQAIHEGLNCKQFQERLRDNSDTNNETKRTREMLQEMVDRGEAMNCPTCQVVLMKKWGCDWLRCSMCKTEICWVTRGPRWGPNGKGDTSGGCQCGVYGVKCHPKCTYCH